MKNTGTPELAADEVRPAAIQRKLRGVKLRASGVVLVFFGVFGTVAATAELDSMAVGMGSTVVESNRKKIQHLEGGIIAKILKRDGDVVATGEALLILDDTRPKVALEVLSNSYWSEIILRERLMAESDKRSMVSLAQIKSERPMHDRVDAIYKSQQQILRSRTAWSEGQTSLINQAIKQKEERIKGLNQLLAAERAEILLIKDEIDTVAGLLAKGLTQKPRLLALQRRQAQIEGEMASNRSEIARIEQEIGEARLKIIQIERDNIKEVQTDLRDSEKRIEELRERLKDAEDVLSRVTVRAAQDGTVVSSTVHSTGQVVRPGEVLMEIVPSSDRLLVEAKIDPRDIEYIALKAQAKVRFVGLPRRTTPTIMGTVSYVSADSIVENNVTFYKVRISISAPEMKKLGIAAVSPGMPTEVMVIAGRRTLMDYLVSPITSVTERAMREKN